LKTNELIPKGNELPTINHTAIIITNKSNVQTTISNFCIERLTKNTHQPKLLTFVKYLTNSCMSVASRSKKLHWRLDFFKPKS